MIKPACSVIVGDILCGECEVLYCYTIGNITIIYSLDQEHNFISHDYEADELLACMDIDDGALIEGLENLPAYPTNIPTISAGNGWIYRR
jgi:hypothetical protein